MDTEFEEEKAALYKQIEEAEQKIHDLENQMAEKKLAHIQVGKYFQSSDGISYTAYHKITRIGPTFVASITVTIGDNIGVETENITSKERFSKYQEVEMESYVSAYDEALAVIIKNKP